jgi:hypothetical protein
MPLQLLDLDDRRFNDLMAEALVRIPADSPEWTNLNPSDPGITLVELLAHLTDVLLYRLNRVTDDNRRTFLKLMNGPNWVPPLDGDLIEETSEAVNSVRKRFRAVTRDDYEYLSKQWLAGQKPSADSMEGRAHCVPQRHLAAGTESERLRARPGHVSVVIVPPRPGPPRFAPARGQVIAPPSNPDRFPQPSAEQLSGLFSHLDERRMLTTRLSVVGPIYVHVSAQLVIARNQDAVDADVAKAVQASLERLLDPLPSDTGEGWPFGRDVFVSDIYQALEKTAGIDFVSDVMLGSACAMGDDKCVVASPFWHAEGDLIGLRIEEHHLPVFEGPPKLVIRPSNAFIAVNVTVSAPNPGNADPRLVKQQIKAKVREKFYPRLKPLPNPTGTVAAMTISKSELETAVQSFAPNASVEMVCTPSANLKTDQSGELFVDVAEGQVVDWRVSIKLT